MFFQGFQGGLILQKHRDIVNHTADLFLIHIDEAPGGVQGVGIAQQLLCQGHAHPPRADDGDFDAVDGLGGNQRFPGKQVEQPPQELAHAGVSGSAFETVAVGHADGQGRQKIDAGDGQKPCKGDLLDGGKEPQDHLEGKENQKRQAIGQLQTDITLNTAVAPDLAVNAAQHPGGNDANAADRSMDQNAIQGQFLFPLIKHQQQQIDRKQDQQVINCQLPPGRMFFHSHTS